MADPFRLQVLKAITAALEQITPANGYTNDMTGKVFRGRTMFGGADPVPLISVLEAPLQPESYEAPQDDKDVYGEMQLLVQGFVKDDPENPTDPAHVLLYEVKHALAKTKVRGDVLGLGSKVDKLLIGGGVCRPADGQISDKTYFWLPVSVELVEDLSEEP